MSVADVRAAAELETAAFPDPWSAQSFRDMLEAPQALLFVALDDAGRLVGYAVGTVAADEGEILNVAVRESHRRQGVARALMAVLLAALEGRGAGNLYLEVRASNEAALALYRSLGFRELGRRFGYYRAPREDAITMVRDRGSEAPKFDSKLHEFG